MEKEMGIKVNFPTIAFAVLLTAAALTDAATYIVGDSTGWTIPSSGAGVYTSWASQHTFAVGDILVFNFAAGQHDVARVTKAAFDICNSTSPLSLDTISPANVTLTSTGDHYFICTFGQHCAAGQKLAINVTSTSGGPTASPPASPPTSPTPPTPSASPTTPPPAAPPAPTPGTAPTPSPASPPAPQSPVSPAPAPGPSPPGSSPSPPSPPPATAPPPGSGATPPPSGSSPSPPPPPPPSSAPPKAVATLALSMILVLIGVLLC